MLVGGRHGEAAASRRCPVGVRRTAWLAASFAVAALVAPGPGSPRPAVAAGTFVVDSTGDQPDASAGDGVCRVAGSSKCTLRAALAQANASPGHDRIEFSIPGAGPHRLRPASDYPIIVDPAGLTIDGYTEPGSVVNTAAHGSNAVIMIELQGTGPSGIDGLYMQSANNVVRGLALFDFQRTVRLWGAGASGNEIVGNFIGTDAAGTFGQSTRTINSTGVHLERGASNNRIGRSGPANRNVISGNGDRGIGIFDPGTDANTIRNNVIGLSPHGSRLRNWGHGIDINYNASHNVIGGSTSANRNVLSGNELSAVEISHDRTGGTTTGNVVVGNLIGTDLTGQSGASTYRNREFGVNIEGRATCPTVSSCQPDVSGNIVEANTIVGSAAGVMIWKAAHDNVVRGNRIGLLPNGTTAPSTANTLWAVLIEAGAFDNLVEQNTIAGGGDGIQVRPDNDYTNLSSNPDIPTFGNTLRRNSIFDVDGFGIDIAPIGAINDTPGELDPDLQGGVAAPAITTATVDRVSVSTCAGCRIELFVTDQGGSGTHLPGRTFLAEATATAGGSATVHLRTSASDPLVVITGQRVTATTTDGAGNTSEFAAWRTVASGSIGGPTSRLQPAQRCGVRC